MNNILETYQVDDVNVGEVFPNTERKTLYGHLKPGDKVFIKRYANAYQKKKGNHFETIEGIVKKSEILTSSQRNIVKNNRSLRMTIKAVKIM